MSSAVTEPDFDVAIVGGGPAGGGMASYLARAGVKCVVLEKELFPRPHVGESLVPSSTRVFKDLEFLPVMEEARFPRKYGAAWTAENANRTYDYAYDAEDLEPSCQVDIQFAERDQPGVDLPYTYHVDRGLFDNLLLQHANKAGAEVYEGVNVIGADTTGDDAATIRFRMGGRDHIVTARMVVDASGRRTVLGNQRKWRVRDSVFNQYAIHTWFGDYDRTGFAERPEQLNFIFIHFLPITNSWIWQIPITETVTSIGVVTQKKHFAAKKEEREKFFWECAESRPKLAAGLRAAKRLRPWTDEGDYSYAMKQLTDDRLVLIGDAARFVDPIFSTGVSIALNSARFAQKDILKALETGDLRRSSFQEYETTIKRGTRNWYNFISVYYRLNVLFTAFISNPKYRIDVIKLLQGDVYDEEEPAVLAEMRRIVSNVEKNSRHVWHDLLGDLTANAFVDLAQRD
jgi:FADH2 O2-dependent halogenase